MANDDFDNAATDREMLARMTGPRMKRPGNADHVPAPGLDDAYATAGVLFHFVGGSAELRGRLARWMEHHEGDLDEQIILWYLTECHALLEPGCAEPMDMDMHPERQR